MAHTKPSTTVLILLLFTTTLSSSPLKILRVEAEADCWFTKQYKVVLINELSDPSTPLIAHCASGDDDLGNHTIVSPPYWGWEFCGHWLGRTMYFCHFWWGKKDQAFEVFNRGLIKKECGTVCRWIARRDGLYLNDGVYTPVKKYDWRN